MQRWIVLGAIVMSLLLGGSYLTLRTIRQNRPHPVWVPLPIKTDLPIATRDEVIKELKTKLSQPELLENVSRDLGLASHFDFTNDKEAAADLAKRLFVRAGEMPQGKAPSIHIGFSGKSKDARLTEKTITRLMGDATTIRVVNDTWTRIGVAPVQVGSPPAPF